MQGSDRDADVENGPVGVVGLNWETGIDICALPRVDQRPSESLLYI